MNQISHVKFLEKLVNVNHPYNYTYVERDFSIDKSLLVENLPTQSLVSQLCIYDYMKSKIVTTENFSVCYTFRKSMSGSRIKHENYLEEQRKAKSRKKNYLCTVVFQESINFVRKKKPLLKSTASDLVKDVDRFSFEAENAKSMEEMKRVIKFKLFQKN